jgi:hypothetical protein
MSIIKDLEKSHRRCEQCGNSKVMYILMKDGNKYHFHYVYDFNHSHSVPHPTVEDIVDMVSDDIKCNTRTYPHYNYEIVAYYCWGCALKGLNKFLMFQKFQDVSEACHLCNKNIYFVKEKKFTMVTGLQNITREDHPRRW